MAELKREYVIPLRRKTQFAPKWRRSKKAIAVVKEFVSKHMKSDNVIICRELNEKIWANGIKNPPGKVSVIALKTELAGVEKTLVNLAEVGINKQLESYAAPQIEAPTEDAKEAVQEAEVKEVSEEKSKETKTEAKKEEVKKDE